MNEEQMKHVANLISQDIEKDKEIERLSEELGDANYTITQLHKVMDRHYIKKEDYDRLNNIIDELEKVLNEEVLLRYNQKYNKTLTQGGLLYRDYIKNKLKELKEGKENDK